MRTLPESPSSQSPSSPWPSRMRDPDRDGVRAHRWGGGVLEELRDERQSGGAHEGRTVVREPILVLDQAPVHAILHLARVVPQAERRLAHTWLNEARVLGMRRVQRLQPSATAHQRHRSQSSLPHSLLPPSLTHTLAHVSRKGEPQARRLPSASAESASVGVRWMGWKPAREGLAAILRRVRVRGMSHLWSVPLFSRHCSLRRSSTPVDGRSMRSTHADVSL